MRFRVNEKELIRQGVTQGLTDQLNRVKRSALLNEQQFEELDNFVEVAYNQINDLIDSWKVSR